MFKVCCLRLFNQCYGGYYKSGRSCDFSCVHYYRLLNYVDFKSIVYKNEIIIVHTTEKIKECIHVDGSYTNVIKIKNIDIDEDIVFVNKSKYNEMIKNNLNYHKDINTWKDNNLYLSKINNNLKNEINKLTKELNKKDELNKRLINTLMLYKYQEFDNTITYDYEDIKQKNKALNAEFKRVAKLMKLC